MEIETFRDILCRQTDTLQSYFDNCAENDNGKSTNEKLDLNDETGLLFLFFVLHTVSKATTEAVVIILLF